MYRALYRKWRPMRFADVVGQTPIVTALQNQILSGRVGHAYLFTGTRGTGKTSCAKIFAKAVNCTDRQGADPCGKCAICTGIDSGSILDVVEIDAASNNGVDNIRDLRDETAYTPSVCAYKVYIIDEVHMLSTAAFNALLKIMEEPPPHVIFILATTEIHKVPATILSRCQRYDFARIGPEDIAARMQYVAGEENIALEPDAAALIARLADGAMRDALSILDTCAGVGQQVDVETVCRMAGVIDRSYLFAFSDALTAGDAVVALAELARLRQQSVDIRRLCEELIAHYRNLMLAAMPGGEGLLVGVPPEAEAQYREKAATLPQSEAIRAIRLLGEALEKMARGTDQRIELELALFSIAQPLESLSPSSALAPTAPQTRAPFVSKPVTTTPPEHFASDAPPLEAPPVEPAEKPQRQTAKTPPPAEQEAKPFARWPEVLQELEARAPLIIAFLHGSHAYYDGRRVLIDAGQTFRDFIRTDKDSQALIKTIIEEKTGVRCGIGPYMEPGAEKSAAPAVQDALDNLKAHGVPLEISDE